MADDAIIIEYKGKIDDLEKKLNQIEKDLKGVDTSAKKSMGNLDSEGKKAASSVNKVDKEVSGLKNKLTDLSNRIPGIFAVQEVLGYGKAIQSAATATTGASTAMKVLKFAIASTGIGALVVALGSLVAYFTQTESGGDRLAKVMRVIGAVVGDVVKVFVSIGEALFTAGEAIADFVSSGAAAVKTTDDYKKSTIELAQEIADLEDQISALTITVDINNSVLQTGIENNLRALRNRNITLGESLKLIDENGKAELKQLQNSNSITDKRLELERKEFILKVKSSDLLSEQELKDKKETLANINTVFGVREKLIQRDIDNHVQALAQLKEQTKLFDQFVNHQIDAQTLLDNVSGEFTEEDLKRVAEVVLAREAAIRNQSNAEEKLKNFRDAALDKDKAEREKEQADKLKSDQDEKKRLDDLLKTKLDAAKRETLANESVAKQKFIDGVISEGALQSQIEKITIDGLNKQREILLRFKRDVSEIDNQIVDIKIKNKQEEIKAELDSDYQFYQQHSKDIKDQYDKDLKAESDFYDALSKQAQEKRLEDEKNEKEHRARLKQILSESIQFASTLLNGLTQRKLNNDNAEIESERNKNEEDTATLIANLEKRKEAGVLSEISFSTQKEAILKRQAKKESELKRKAFEAQKSADLTTILINTAVAIAKSLATYGFTPAGAIAAAAAAAEGGVQYALVASKQTPKFKEGGEVKGKSHSQGGVIIEAEGGEYITKVSQTQKYKGLLESVNNDTVEKYLFKDYVSPIIEKQKKAHNKELRQLETALHLATMANSNQLDTSHMERLIKKNKNIGIEKNSSAELARMIGKEINRNNPEMK